MFEVYVHDDKPKREKWTIPGIVLSFDPEA